MTREYHELPPEVDTQAELYHALTRPDGGYPAISQEQWNKEADAQSEWYRADPRPAEKPHMTSWDYLIMATLDGVEYWLPNDEEWFDVVAVDHTNRLAAFTGFCEMNDFEYEDSDYRYKLDPSDGKLKCKFEIKS